MKPKNLIVVESPTKAKTLSQFLGSGYEIASSYGHVRDLPKSKLGIDVAHNFTPTYVIPPKAKPVVAELKKKASEAENVILATDEDREGEAIAWHLAYILGIIGKTQSRKRGAKTDDNPRPAAAPPIQRIAFHEITKSAVLEALANPRSIDAHLVDAQQARRVLDRLVGYELSPFLWRKIRYGLSAGRVQSVAARLVVEREREIEKFIKEEYWSIEAIFEKRGVKKPFPAQLISYDSKQLGKMDVKTEAQAREITEKIRGERYGVEKVTKRDATRTPAPPFTTATLQQEASRKLGFSAKQTMTIAQRLYEEGLITYMRTDSVNLSSAALSQAKQVIASQFGTEYALPEPRRYATKSKGAQEAHEAIRPTDLERKASDAALGSDRGRKRLYDLIWKRTIASQMQSARFEQTTVDIISDKKDASFRANGQVVKFDGFIKVYLEGKDEPDSNGESNLPPGLAAGDALNLSALTPLQHFTEPPPRYTDATLIKALEAEGVGRPSTYAPTLSTIQDRGYVEKIDRAYHPTEIGIVVNDLLVKHFPEIVDIHFTSHIEEELDNIAEGKIGWTSVCDEFYAPFKKRLEEKEVTVTKQVEVSTTPCPHCGKMMLIKFGKMGKFLACPDPESKVTLPLPEEAEKIRTLKEQTKGECCPVCGKEMEVKRGRFGFFLGCSDYPNCKGVSKIWNKTGFKCPACETRSRQLPATNNQPAGNSLIGDIVEKKGRGRRPPFYACTRYPECTFLMNKKPESEEQLRAAFEEWKNKPPTKKRKITTRVKKY